MLPSLNKKQSLSCRTTFLPPYSGRRTWSPNFTPTGGSSPPFPLEPDPTATSVAYHTFPWDFSGSIISPLVTVSAAFLSIQTPVCKHLSRHDSGFCSLWGDWQSDPWDHVNVGLCSFFYSSFYKDVSLVLHNNSVVNGALKSNHSLKGVKTIYKLKSN